MSSGLASSHVWLYLGIYENKGESGLEVIAMKLTGLPTHMDTGILLDFPYRVEFPR